LLSPYNNSQHSDDNLTDVEDYYAYDYEITSTTTPMTKIDGMTTTATVMNSLQKATMNGDDT